MNVNEVKSDFQFVGNRIAEFSIKTENSNPGKLNLKLDIDYNINDVIEKGEMMMGTLDFLVDILGETVDGDTPLLIRLVMEGCFTASKESISINRFRDMIEKNGLITLSQISRSYLISATSLSGISPAIKLPMINIFSLIEKKTNKSTNKN